MPAGLGTKPGRQTLSTATGLFFRAPGLQPRAFRAPRGAGLEGEPLGTRLHAETRHRPPGRHPTPCLRAGWLGRSFQGTAGKGAGIEPGRRGRQAPGIWNHTTRPPPAPEGGCGKPACGDKCLTPSARCSAATEALEKISDLEDQLDGGASMHRGEHDRELTAAEQQGPDREQFCYAASVVRLQGEKLAGSRHRFISGSWGCSAGRCCHQGPRTTCVHVTGSSTKRTAQYHHWERLVACRLCETSIRYPT